MIHILDNTNLLTWFKNQTVPTGIVHQCNCFCTMGGGIARQIAVEYPEAVEADNKTKRGDKRKMGSFTAVVATENPRAKKIYNLYGQYHFGALGYDYMLNRHTSYDALTEGLEKVKMDAVSDGIKQLGIPYNIGCGLGGGDWAVVSGILASVFGNCPDLDLYICQFEPK